MKTFTKVAVFVVLVLALSPFAGFWIVALVGAGLVLLPVGALLVALFPKKTEWLLNTVQENRHYLIPAG